MPQYELFYHVLHLSQTTQMVHVVEDVDILLQRLYDEAAAYSEIILHKSLHSFGHCR
jgi:hypothetical protein